jgi:hypothetical protein
MQEGKNGDGADQQEKPKLSEAQRCHQLMMRIVDVAVEEFPAEVPRRDRRYGARSAGAPATAAGSSDRLQNLGEVTAPASSAHLLILKGK